MGKILKPNEPNVISEPMEGELVVINLESGCYYSLNRPAAKIWSCLNRGLSVEQIIAAQQGDGLDETEVRDTIASFCGFLEEEMLMIASVSDQDQPMCASDPYEKPVIEKFSDMQEMLLLDPIHEVSEMGWPNEADK